MSFSQRDFWLPKFGHSSANSDKEASSCKRLGERCNLQLHVSEVALRLQALRSSRKPGIWSPLRGTSVAYKDMNSAARVSGIANVRTRGIASLVTTVWLRLLIAAGKVQKVVTVPPNCSFRLLFEHFGGKRPVLTTTGCIVRPAEVAPSLVIQSSAGGKPWHY